MSGQWGRNIKTDHVTKILQLWDMDQGPGLKAQPGHLLSDPGEMLSTGTLHWLKDYVPRQHYTTKHGPGTLSYTVPRLAERRNLTPTVDLVDKCYKP